MSNQKEEVKRRVLCDEEKVFFSSLPYSLRHTTSDDPLYDAAGIVCFLVDVSSSTEELSKQGTWGLEMILHYLRDKIDIARGVYCFPKGGFSNALPALVEREEE